MLTFRPRSTIDPPSPWFRAWRMATMLLLLGWTTGCASLPANTNRVASTAFAQPEETALGQLTVARRAQAGARSDSAFHLLSDVDAALAARIALIDDAQRTLDLQYYAIHADASTEVLLQGLRNAARRGVRVRILLDDFNSVGKDTQVLRLAFEPNVQMRLFNPIPGSRQNMVGRILTSLDDVAGMQKRMHNKLFIADNAWGVTGGRNLGDVYFGAGDKQNFVDLDVLAAGRIVRDMSASFDRFWNDELAYPVQTLLSPEDLDKLRKPEAPASAPGGTAAGVTPAAAASLPVTVSPTVIPSVSPAAVARADRAPLDLRTLSLTWAPSILLADKPGKIGPGDDEVNAGETAIDGLLSLMQQAHHDVLIISPYFVPGEQMMAVYRQLRQRGVRMRVLTNSLASNDAPAAHAGYARYRQPLLDMGVELYEMRSAPETAAKLAGSGGGTHQGSGGWMGSGVGGSKGGTSRASLHSKVVIIDGYYAVIGSMNLDLRSQLKNSEVGLVIRSPALAQQATAHAENTLATAAYRLERKDGHLYWRAPPGAGFADASSEPEASTKLKLLVKLLGPLAPDQML
ncbi:phospholipase D family protein [Ramlibacter ginsenosidimutans]|uniref:Phospholipase D family protein n=1 Tax=Ramlibacter ginsenosidimutans TaxID=502333 RepID=A0A934WM21_9BURK|nr:phospholipase D family protein [Ramlibacter ginsenosidimutans]MBK6006185.1 phospholipase D family protein [Ramlibacter ginsenosidimutans]